MVQRLRKRKFLGLKLKQRHTKADLRAFASLGSDMRSGVLKEGFLMKRGDNHQSWKRRWCILSHIGFGFVVLLCVLLGRLCLCFACFARAPGSLAHLSRCLHSVSVLPHMN